MENKFERLAPVPHNLRHYHSQSTDDICNPTATINLGLFCLVYASTNLPFFRYSRAYLYQTLNTPEYVNLVPMVQCVAILGQNQLHCIRSTYVDTPNYN